MRHSTTLRVGPVGFRIGSDWRAPIDALHALYRDYPQPDIPDVTVRLEAPRPWRRWVRPQVAIGGDLTLPGAVPLPLAHAMLAAEMAMNLQIALGWRRHLLLHAAVVDHGRVRCGQVDAGGPADRAGLAAARRRVRAARARHGAAAPASPVGEPEE